jgi:hypothetical protein
MVFAVVGHVGSGTSEIAKQLKIALEDIEMAGEHSRSAQILRIELEVGRKMVPPWST